jgi:hypothetical protein
MSILAYSVPFLLAVGLASLSMFAATAMFAR